jgi:antitoxin component YwqK of YwqJK toxin-antitoxin module
MKLKLLLLLPALFVVIHVNAQETEFDPNKLKSEYFQDKDVKDGLVFDDKKGNTYKIKNSEYNKGLYIKQGSNWLKHGAFYTYYNGKVNSKTMCKLGKREGLSEKYNSNNGIKRRCNFKNNLKNGVDQFYQDDGVLFEEKTYKNGLAEGTRTEYYSNGQEHFVTLFSNDKRHGESLQYDKNGKLLSKTEYKEGNKIGKTVYY